MNVYHMCERMSTDARSAPAWKCNTRHGKRADADADARTRVFIAAFPREALKQHRVKLMQQMNNDAASQSSHRFASASLKPAAI